MLREPSGDNLLASDTFNGKVNSRVTVVERDGTEWQLISFLHVGVDSEGTSSNSMLILNQQVIDVYRSVGRKRIAPGQWT